MENKKKSAKTWQIASLHCVTLAMTASFKKNADTAHSKGNIGTHLFSRLKTAFIELSLFSGRFFEFAYLFF